MKKAVAILVIILIAASFTLVGCAYSDVGITPVGDNLMKGATAITAEGSKATSLVDGKALTVFKAESSATVTINLDGEKTFNTAVFLEDGSSITLFRLSAKINDEWVTVYEQDQMLDYHLAYTETVTTDTLLFEAEADGEIKINDIELYNQPKRNSTFRVSSYLTVGNGLIETLYQSADFTGYFDVITDCIIIGSVRLDENGQISYYKSQKDFASELAHLKLAIGERPVRLWCTVLFDRYTDGSKDFEATTDFLNNNMDTITASLKAFVEEYGIYGIDFDWEYPYERSHWKAYDNLVIETAEVLGENGGVSVAVPPYTINFSDEAIEAAELFNLMTYDMFDARGNHCDMMIGGVSAASYLINIGVPREKILLGIPTYSRTTDKSSRAWPSYGEFTDSLGKWGNVIKDYTYTVEGNKITADAYVNGYALARSKTALASTMELGGVMVFRTKCDAPYSYEYSIIRGIGEVKAALA